MEREPSAEARLEEPEKRRLLVERARGGDQSALLALYSDAAPALYAWTSLRLGGKLLAGVDPQDVLQEVWLRALDNLGGYDPQRSFCGWLVGIAKNVVLQLLEHGPRGARAGAPIASGALRAIPDAVTTVCSRMGKDEVLARFFAFVEGLSEEDRLLVTLCGLEQRSCAEAAEQLCISTDAATKRWQVLRARMRESGALRALAEKL